MYTQIIINQLSIAFFSLQYIRMSDENINFDDKKKSKKASSTKTKEYIVLTILMLIIY